MKREYFISDSEFLWNCPCPSQSGTQGQLPAPGSHRSGRARWLWRTVIMVCLRISPTGIRKPGEVEFNRAGELPRAADSKVRMSSISLEEK